VLVIKRNIIRNKIIRQKQHIQNKKFANRRIDKKTKIQQKITNLCDKLIRSLDYFFIFFFTNTTQKKTQSQNKIKLIKK